mmetsp:Transcript_19316/g.26715  ORF Transcript_19316/g.26715 Transcript_19316/m.26715 type:complete len:208 (+) Transcript_19316:36-659(+)
MNCSEFYKCFSHTILQENVTTTRVLNIQSSFVIFYRFEQFMKVSFSESTTPGRLLQKSGVHFARQHTTNPLNDFDEHRGSVAQRLGENLQQNSLIIFVDEDPELFAILELGLGESSYAHLLRRPLVVAVCRRGHEIESPIVRAISHGFDGAENVVRFERDVLHPRTIKLLEIGLDLALPVGAKGGLIHGQQHALVITREHHTVEPRV